MICTLHFEKAGVCIAILRRFSNPVRPALRQKRLASAGVWPLGDVRAAELPRAYWAPWADGQPWVNRLSWANVCRGQMCAVDGMIAVCGLAGAGGFFAGVYAAENFPCGMSFGGAGGRRLWQRLRRGHILSPKYLFAFIAQRVALRNALESGDAVCRRIACRSP